MSPNMRGGSPAAHAKPKNMWGTIKRLLGYVFKNYKLQFSIVLVAILIGSLANVAGTYFLKILIDSYIVPLIGAVNPDLSAFIGVILIMAGIYLMGIISTYLYSRLMLNVSQGTLKYMRDDLFRHMETLPIKYFDTHTHGDMMSRYTNDIDTLRQMISQSLPQLISSLVTVISVFIFMCILSWELTMIVLVMLVAVLFIIKKIGGKSGKFFMQQQRAIGKVNGYVEEMIEGQRVVKVFCHEQKAKDGFDKLNDELCYTGAQANTYANILMPIMNNLSYVHYVLTAIIGVVFAITGIGAITIGTIVSFLQYTRNFAQPITQMSQQANSVVMALAGAERIFAMMDEMSETNDGKVLSVRVKKVGDDYVETDEKDGILAWKVESEGVTSYVPQRGEVVFKNVDFAYDEGKPVLIDMSLYAKAGEKIAFVGSTGAGKTTITNLINRFYDINDGLITYDGININDIDKNSLRRTLGMVLQDTHLFTGSVYDNIRYGRLDATDEEVIAAAKLAGADEFIAHLSEGYDTVLKGDGDNLSQGQRQLLAIARAAVSNPPVLILDEATSSIDTRSEKLIEIGMDRLMEGRTVFVIAHRLSTVRNAKAIMVLEKGKIIERGNHQQLIAQKGKYYQLYTGAFEMD